MLLFSSSSSSSSSSIFASAFSLLPSTTTTTASRRSHKNRYTTARSYHLVIVESPAKCKTIETILNTTPKKQKKKKNDTTTEYRVLSCYGHIRDLPRKVTPAQKLVHNQQQHTHTTFPYPIAGIDLTDGQYTPTYTVVEAKRTVVDTLVRAAADAESIVLATDPDREGEAMAWHLQTVLSSENNNNNNNNNSTTTTKRRLPTFQRIRFSEITATAIQTAMEESSSSSSSSVVVSSSSSSNDDTNNNNNNAAAVVAMDLVNAQETRRVLDRLAGFTVSPVLWKKIAPGLSAGRVQSVGLQVLVERERERLLHVPVTYYTIQAELLLHSTAAAAENGDDTTTKAARMTAQLHSINQQRVVKAAKDLQQQKKKENSSMTSSPLLHLDTEEAATVWVDGFLHPQQHHNTSTSYTVTSLQQSQRTRQPPVPYKTSTLQQDAVRRLQWTVQTTMRVAQQLYEAGWISYMRTDSTVLSATAQHAVHATLAQEYKMTTHDNENDDMRIVQRNQTKKSKHAQEAHEAIRPAVQEDGTLCPPDRLPVEEAAAQALYTMIYQRTLAYSMPQLVTNLTTVMVTADNGTDTMEFKLTGSVVVKPGYTVVYAGGENSSDSDDDDDDDATKRRLPPLTEGQVLTARNLTAIHHETQPPPRYSEASFVKELEALGVGRPSTYARVVNVLRERAYVRSTARQQQQKSRRGSAISALRAAGMDTAASKSSPSSLVPTLSAFVVCSLLEKYCPSYVDASFTATMEDQLDLIANGDDQRVQYLNDFYAGPDGLAAKVKRIEDEADANAARRVILPPRLPGDSDIALYIGPWGPFVKRDNETASLPMALVSDVEAINTTLLEAVLEMKKGDNSVIGQHPSDGRNLRLKTGRFGAYLQWGDDGEEGTTTHSLPKEKSMVRLPTDNDVTNNDDAGEVGDEYNRSLLLLNITFDEVVGYTGLPRTVCTFQDLPIVAAIGPYGPYLKYNNTYASLTPELGDVLTVDATTAQQIVTDEIINKPNRKPRGVLAELGEKDGSKVYVKAGRFGNYINWKKVNAKIPAEFVDSPDTVPLETAWDLILAKDAAGPSKRGSKNDPNLPPRPKRPLSAYLHFCAAKRPEVATAQKKLGDVSKQLAALWAETPPEARIEFEALAQQGKEEHQVKLDEWRKECKSLGKKGGAKSDGRPKPKRPLSAYLYFCAEKRPEVSQRMKKLGDISKELARLWAETADRTVYEKLAEKDKARYQSDLVDSRTSSASTAAAVSTKREVKRKATRRKGSAARRESKVTQQHRPKRPLSAYLFFCAEKRPEVSQRVKKLGDVSKELARQWAETADRSQFEQLAKEDKARYQTELADVASASTSSVQLIDTKNPRQIKIVGNQSKKKRGKSAYMLFCAEKRPLMVDEVTGEKLPFGDAAKRLASLWHECDDATKEKFRQMASKEAELLSLKE